MAAAKNKSKALDATKSEATVVDKLISWAAARFENSSAHTTDAAATTLIISA